MKNRYPQNNNVGPRRFERRSQDPQSCRMPGYPMAPPMETRMQHTPYKLYLQPHSFFAPTITIQRPHTTSSPLNSIENGSNPLGTMMNRNAPVATVPSPTRRTPARADTRVRKTPTAIKIIPAAINGSKGSIFPPLLGAYL